MAKKVQATVKLQLPAGKATPAPPVGTALGPQGVNIMDFVKQFNAKTAKEPDGMIIPALVTIYSDRTFTFHYQDVSGFRASEACRRNRQGIRRTKSQQGGQSDAQASRRDRQNQIAGLEHHQS